MSPKGVAFSLITFALLLAASQISAKADSFVIDTTPANDIVSPFGFNNTATYGQVITAVAGTTQLDSFSFNIQTGSTITYRAFVMAWNGTMATGPILFQSGNQVASGNNSYTYNTGGINLTPGTQYVLFASVSLHWNPSNGSGVFGARSDNPYFGGSFVFLNNLDNAAEWTSSPWIALATHDLAFTASFSTPSAIPEPATMFLLSTGLAVLATGIRNRLLRSR